MIIRNTGLPRANKKKQVWKHGYLKILDKPTLGYHAFNPLTILELPLTNSIPKSQIFKTNVVLIWKKFIPYGCLYAVY